MKYATAPPCVIFHYFVLFYLAKQVYIQPKFYKKKEVCPTPSPTPGPDEPFALYAEGERCLEGQQAPFAPSSRERSLMEMSKDGLYEHNTTEIISAQENPFATPYECWYYCSIYGGVPAPFYFNWNVRTRDCYCCGTYGCFSEKWIIKGIGTCSLWNLIFSK